MKTINSFRSKLFALTLAIVASVSSFAYDEMPDFQVDGLYYNFLEDENVEVTHPYIPVVPVENVASNTKKKSHAISADDYYNLTNLVIPSTVTYEGKVYNVTRIGFDAFNQCDKLTFVDIPSSVKTIGVGAFYFCSSLTSITLKEGLEHIEWNAFEDCRSLENITFPNSLKTIGNYAFSNTLWYKNHPNGAVYAGNVFYKYKGDIPQNTSFVIKEGTVSISPYAFVKENYHEDYSLVSVSIPNSVEVIGEGAFYRCRALTSIVIPDGVTTIETLAFHYCKALKSVTCEAVNPPALSGSVFLSTPIADATLYVPAESIEAYKTAAQWKEFGQILPIEQTPEDLFPTLWGLQRTTFYHYTDCSESASSLTVSNEIVTINDKPYLRFGDLFLREENNRVLIYSEAYDKDLVLYDWNLEVGDSVTLLAFDFGFYPEDAASVVDYRVIVDIDDNGDLVMDTIPTDKVVVDKISTITLLDGKEYKMWHLATGWAGGITYVEGIGIFGEGYFEGDYFGLIQIEELPACYYGDLLVCITRNGQLLYKMDDAEMEQLETECLCDYDNGPRKDNAKNGKIGGRPTPTQWNMLEVDLREMEHGNTILRAETFSYTLENDSIVTNGKTFYQLARQSTKDTAITKSFVGALHFGEDEDNRVYFFRDGHEYVLYDFTAEPGDTLEIFAGINNYPQDSTYTHVVIGKDTIENGACRMTLEVVFPNQTSGYDLQKVWLAGLGSIDGIVHNAAKRTSDTHAAPSRSAHNSDTQTSIMLCAWRDDNCLYTTDHPDYGTYGCVYNQESTSIEDIHTSPSYQKFIRDGQLFILYNGNIYNVMGVELK